ncbi:amidohydrolase family protein [Pontibacter silvestris]|uniref:Amidohydrolase family protein n=1 Tax=Pontibacter silvestris TaxID=2305183 RepID=A0ABW4WYD7_9BACT|nr:amidohydrolase family protein [Pontibacter silvestris]MCC9138437.1 amidohydrolase family protein [Pontibacter silvestris]
MNRRLLQNSSLFVSRKALGKALPVLLIHMCSVSAFAFSPTSSPLDDSIRVTLTEGTNMAIDLSPDKKTIVMDLQGTIWAMPVGGGDAKALTDALGDSRQPAWSPDGSRVAFHSYRDGNYHIWTVNKNGTGLEQITTGIYDDREPHWSPDGKSLVFSSDRGGNYDVWQIELASGNLKQLTDNPANDYYPAFAADGKQIAFVSERTEAPGIYALSLEGKEQLLIPSESKLAAPSWHPNNSQVLYNALSQHGQSRLEAAMLGDGGGQTISDASEDVFPFRVSWISPIEFLYTADGKIKRRKLGKKSTQTVPFKAVVALYRPAYPRKAYTFDNVAPQPVQGIRGASVAPDGKRIVFSALSDLWVLEKGKRKPVALTHDAYVEVDPAWSPDGTKLAYVSDRNGSMDLWIRDLETGDERLLTDLPNDLNFPSWSPDGARIAFYEGDLRNAWGRGTLNAVEVGSGKVVKLHESMFVPGQPSWSADGKTIAISALEVYSSRYREGISKFLLVSLDGQPDRYVSPVPERSLGTRGKNGPVWSPDGSMMAYTLDGVLWVVPVDKLGTITGPPKRLTNELAEVPGWAADSKSIVFLATDALKQVYLADGHIESIPMDFTWQYKQPTGRKVIHAGKLFDGRASTYQTNVDIIVEGNRIKEILPHQAGRQGTLIDASDKTVIPGLFEMHTHQSEMAGEKLGRLWLSYGITSLRETGADPYDAIERKESWNSGARKGPREFFTGGLTDGSRIYYGLATSINSGAQLELELERTKRLGYDLIKTYVRMPDLMQERITAYAHSIGIPVSSHEIYPATRYGVDAVEHIGGTSRRGYSPKITSTNHTYQDVTELLAKSGMNITPTASLQGGFYVMAGKDPNFFENRQFKAFYSEAYAKELKEGATQVTKMFPGYISNFGNIQQTVKALLVAGARVTTGTDSPFIPYGMGLHTELQSWVDGGVSPYEALRSATLWAAEAVGVSKDLGSIEPGKLADLVIVNGDPLAHIQDAWNVETVLKNGEVHQIEDLLKRPSGN